MIQDSLPIIDCHQHFYDSSVLGYGVFTAPSAALTALVGDYAALPRIYTPDDYEREIAGLNVAGSVWAEFISSDPEGEVRWAVALARDNRLPSSLIGLVDFADPGLDRLLDGYAAAGPVHCVRQHLGWHPTQPSLRSTTHPDMLFEPALRRGISALRDRGLVCEIRSSGSPNFFAQFLTDRLPLRS